MTPAGIVTVVVVVVVVVAAYGSKIPGLRWLKSNVASKLPRSEAAAA